MDSVSNVRDLAHVAELLKAHDRYLIVPHVQPDPDAFGSTCGLASLLRRLGKTVVVYSDEPVPANCRFLMDYFPVVDALPTVCTSNDDDGADAWRLIFIDGGERHRQPAPVREWETWLNLDHHEGNGQYARWIYVDTQAASSSQIVTRLAPLLGLPLDEASASCVFSGMLFDTRNAFVTDRCTPEVFRLVGDMVAAGARPDRINTLLNEQMTMGDFRLYGAALAGLATADQGRVVYATLSRAMITESGGTDQAMEMLTLNLPKIAGGEIYVLFKEAEDGSVKVSLRSKGRLTVSAVARQFGGGGHRFAAGARLPGPMSQAVQALVAACEQAIAEQLGAGVSGPALK